MKKCAICGEQLEDRAIRCSEGHSRFELGRSGQTFSEVRQIVEDTLRQSSVGYTESDLSYLTNQIVRTCLDAQAEITPELADRIRRDVEEKQRQRLETKRQQEEESKRRRRLEEQRQRERERLLNMEIEEILPVFRGFTEGWVPQAILIRLLADVLDVCTYSQMRFPKDTIPVDFPPYTDNRIFWDDALGGRLTHGMRIHLDHFHVMEWVPSAPGRYYTREAQRARARAKDYVDYERGEFLPLGKENMVLGGIGSIRMGAKHTDFGEVHPLCATSSGISHQGIPVILLEKEFRQVMYAIRDFGGCRANITGCLKVLPETQVPIEYDVHAKRFFLFVEQLEIIGPSDQLLATVAITFSGSNQLDDKLWSFSSFDPTHQDVSEAAAWLSDYTLRHSHTSQPTIVGDFDEHCRHFRNRIEFPLADLVRGQIDYERLSKYQNALNFTYIGECTMGDKLDFSGAIISSQGGQVFVGKFRDTIANLDASGHHEFGNSLAQLKDAVERSNHLSDDQKREISELIQQLGQEAAEPEPNKSLMKALGEGLMTTLRAIPDVAKAAAALAPFLAQLLI